MSDKLAWTNDTMRLADLVPWEHNPKRMTKKQAEGLRLSIEKFGFAVPFLVSPDGDIYDGHQRDTLMKAMREYGPNATVDVRVSSRPLTDDERRELVVRLKQNQAGWNFDMLANLYEREELLEWGFEDAELGMFGEDLLGVSKDAKPNPRNLPIDAIFCWGGGDTSCCLAVRAGWLYGVRSSDISDVSKVCPVVARSERHAVQFVDNEFLAYDHKHHCQIVQVLRPKYATIRDVMTKEQCLELGITFYEFGQIMDWAEELTQYADNVIVVPKYDCIDKIPEKFMLGYSVPTEYGGTPLPVEMFKGRRVHLLGGSWKAQLAHMAALGDDVVSFDNNHVERVASRWGQYCDPVGVTTQLQEIGLGYLINVRDVALCMSFGAIGSKVNELYAGSANPAE